MIVFWYSPLIQVLVQKLASILLQRKVAGAERIRSKGIGSALLSYGSSHPARISKKPWRWGAQRMVGSGNFCQRPW